MSERVKGEVQELHEAIGRMIRLRSHNTGTAERPAQQTMVTIPKAIARLMLERTELWQWDVTEEGVLLRPIEESPPLPSWTNNGGNA